MAKPSSRRPPRLTLVLLLSLAACGCGHDGGDAAPGAAQGASAEARGEPVTPPFAVKGNCKGLLLQWFDAEGVHTADARDAIPAAHRKRVRVESLTIDPDERLDPAMVYVADLGAAGEGGAYPVREVPRATFDAWVEKAAGTADEGSGASATGDADVIVYGASWCGACKAAERFFDRRHVPYVVKDIDHDPGAAAEMRRKAERAGLPVGSIPLIDFRGTLMSGFDQQRIEQLLGRGTRTL